MYIPKHFLNLFTRGEKKYIYIYLPLYHLEMYFIYLRILLSLVYNLLKAMLFITMLSLDVMFFIELNAFEHKTYRLMNL